MLGRGGESLANVWNAGKDWKTQDPVKGSFACPSGASDTERRMPFPSLPLSGFGNPERRPGCEPAQGRLGACTLIYGISEFECLLYTWNTSTIFMYSKYFPLVRGMPLHLVYHF